MPPGLLSSCTDMADMVMAAAILGMQVVALDLAEDLR